MNWLVSAPLWVLLVGWLAVTIVAAVLGHLFVSRVVHGDERDEVRGLAYPMMPALGAMFAVLTAITLSSEAGYLKSAQDGVSQEAAAASKLAWAATNPNVDAAPIHASLERYLVATRTNEWSGDAAATGDDPETADALADLEHTVRTAAADADHRDPGGQRAAGVGRRDLDRAPGPAGRRVPRPARAVHHHADRQRAGPRRQRRRHRVGGQPSRPRCSSPA